MKRRTGAALAALLVVPLSGAVSALAAVPGGNPGPGLAAVGPVSATNGYPVWYKDKNGMRLELCVAAADPLCPARGPLPDENAPVSFPENYPDEAFYSLASANLTTGNAGKAVIDMNLEAAFAAGPVVDGDQVTFARTRIKITNVKDGVDYTVTTPVGVKKLQSSKPGLIFDTEDIGIGGAGDFTGALGGRIGPFLTWDTFGSKTDPALKGDTYIGDGATPHTIKGSPYGTNFVRIEGPGINPSATTDGCPSVAGPISDCLETNLFTIQGKLATTAGVAVQQAAYARTSSSGGTIDVFATTDGDTPQAIQVTDPKSGTFETTGLVGESGHYYARVAYSGATPPAQVQVSNVGDVPASVKTIAVTDRLTGSATYDNGKGDLLISASSSDAASEPTLTATGYGTITGGTLTVPLVAPPATVTVTSSGGGSLTLPVEGSGTPTAALPVVAQAGPDQSVLSGQTVTLDGSSSSGPVKTFSWTGPGDISLSGAGTAKPTFTAPTVASPTTYTFSLTVTGTGGPSTATANVTVQPPAPSVTADAGPAQTGVQRGTKVTLDGSRSVGAASYAWTQVKATGDPTVTLVGADTAHPTFTFPFYKSPDNNGKLVFSLVVKGVDGTISPNTATVDITPSSDNVQVSAARFQTGAKWRVDGTSSVIAGQTVTAHLGSLTGTLIGTAVVDPTGAFSVRPASGPTPKNGDVVVVESQLGGVSTPFTVRIG